MTSRLPLTRSNNVAGRPKIQCPGSGSVVCPIMSKAIQTTERTLIETSPEDL
jgi:hypothetical protein